MQIEIDELRKAAKQAREMDVDILVDVLGFRLDAKRIHSGEVLQYRQIIAFEESEALPMGIRHVHDTLMRHIGQAALAESGTVI
jgi:hypothetical protein